MSDDGQVCPAVRFPFNCGPPPRSSSSASSTFPRWRSGAWSSQRGSRQPPSGGTFLCRGEGVHLGPLSPYTHTHTRTPLLSPALSSNKWKRAHSLHESPSLCLARARFRFKATRPCPTLKDATKSSVAPWEGPRRVSLGRSNAPRLVSQAAVDVFVKTDTHKQHAHALKRTHAHTHPIGGQKRGRRLTEAQGQSGRIAGQSDSRTRL